jgi:hypothetical protein
MIVITPHRKHGRLDYIGYPNQCLSLFRGTHAMLELFNENVTFHQEKSFMFYNVQTTFWTFVSKKRTPEYDVSALRNSK